MSNLTPQEILAAVEQALVEAARFASLTHQQERKEATALGEMLKSPELIEKEVSLDAPLVSSDAPKGHG